MTRAECLAFERAVIALLGPGESKSNADGLTIFHTWLLPSTEGGDVQLTLFTGSNVTDPFKRTSALLCQSEDGKDCFDPIDFELEDWLSGIVASPYINGVSA